MEEKLEKRRFSSHRLYQLIRGLVLVLAGICFFLAIIGAINAHTWVSTNYDVDISNCLQNYQNPNGQGQAYCTGLEDSKVSTQEGAVVFTGFLGVLILALFFGGVWIYRYVYPVSQNSDAGTLYGKALRIASEYDYISAALLQRHLGISYIHAAKLLDRLTENGVVEHAFSNKPRKVLKTATV